MLYHFPYGTMFHCVIIYCILGCDRNLKDNKNVSLFVFNYLRITASS